MRPTTSVALATGLLGAMAAVPATYLAVISVAATRRPADAEQTPTRTNPHLAVLVPAHDEAALIGRCLAGLADQDYPVELRRVVVVADNCTDDTAAIAVRLGADAMQRDDPAAPGKGHALRWAMDRLLDSHPEVDAFVVVDADSVTDRGLLSALAEAHARGASVAQADYGALVSGEGARSQLRAAAFLLFHRVRFTGKARLGLPCGLVGNGMLFSREVATRHPWSAFSEVEDLEYGLQLRLLGIAPKFVPGGSLTAPVAPAGIAADVQRTRWEGGRMQVSAEYLPRLLRAMLIERRGDLWDAAMDVAVPPLGVLTAGTVAGTAGALALRTTGVVGTTALTPWMIATAALPVHVLVGMRAGDAPPGMTRALLTAPRLILSEMVTRLGLLVNRTDGQWVRTPREDSGPA